MKKYAFTAKIESEPGGGSFVYFPYDVAEEFGTKDLIAGKTYKLRIDFGSASTSTMKNLGVVSFGGGGARLGACPKVDVEETIEKAANAAKEADFAVLCTGLNVCTNPNIIKNFLDRKREN